MSDWPVADVVCAKSAVSHGTVGVTTSSSVHTKGAWTQLVAATTYDFSGVIVWFDWADAAGREYMIDVGVGAAGSETVIVPNLALSRCSTTDRLFHSCVYLPISIPAGSRLSLRAQSGVSGAYTMYVAVQGLVGGAPLGLSSVAAIGAVPSLTDGVSVAPGANGTWGGWTEVTAACANDIKHLSAHMGSQGRATGTQQFWTLQVATGASGAEQILIDTMFTAETNVGIFMPQYPHGFFVDIPQGTRLSVRGMKQGSGGNTSAIILYGAY